MTGRGRAGNGKSTREQASLDESHSRSKSRGKQSPPPDAKAKSKAVPRVRSPRGAREKEKRSPPPDAKAKINSEERSSKPRCASGQAHITKTKKKCSATSDATDSVSGVSTSPNYNGDVKPKQKRELAKNTPECKDTADTKKTSSRASGKAGSNVCALSPQRPRRAESQKAKLDKKNSCSPLDERASRVLQKVVGSPAKDYASANKVLLSTLDKLKIKTSAKSDSSSIINFIVNIIIKHMKEKSEYFRDVEKLCTGSYYENVKISEPDEFDVMLAVRVDRVVLQKFDEEGAFYSVALKRTPSKKPVRCFLQEDNTLSASQMLHEFREHVKKSVESTQGVRVERKKAGCPAVTLLVMQDDMEIGLDIVLSLEVHSSWPEFTKDGFQIDSWLGTKVKKDYKSRPFYLVPKYTGKGNEERDGVSAKDAWRISFSNVEKAILINHGQAKTCCEIAGIKCCRKPCLKLLKYLLHQLKEKHPSELSKFFSYLCKTTLLHACAARPADRDWDMADLSDCFQQLLEDFVGHLRQAQLPNFFIPTQNLLGSPFDKKRLEFLADCIEMERNNGFPIFGK